jgi:catechol 2,3-dioxygenase-like lactoylglutathione lyase family enzyme
MSQEVSPRLSHVGLYVSDVPKMIDFYTRVLGFVVSDGAEDRRITFLSRNPSDHHQVVLVRGRQTGEETPMVQQVSFNVGTLGNVQRVFRKVRDAACKVIDPRCHGNAWSVYFSDPEGNRIEMFCDTPWYVPQPLGYEIDLDKSEDELYRETEQKCRAMPGFKPMEQWRAEISKKIAATLDA